MALCRRRFCGGGEDVCRIRLQEPIPERSIVLIKRKEQPLSVAARELEQRILEQAVT